MTKSIRKLIAILLSAVMVLLVFPTEVSSAGAMTQEDFNSRINTLKRAYPNGSVCRSTQFGRSCFGWAYLIGYQVFGSSPSGWSTSYSLRTVKAGDIIQYGNTTGRGHTVFVTKVSGNTIYYADCNGNGNRDASGQFASGLCMVKWDNCTTISANSLFGHRFAYIKSAPKTVGGGAQPKDTAAPAASTQKRQKKTAAPAAQEKSADTDSVRFFTFSPLVPEFYLRTLGESRTAGRCFEVDPAEKERLEGYDAHSLLLLR